jgi:putative transposase
MENYRRSSHSVYDLTYHLVWITKYRKPVLKGPVAIRLLELIREICKSKDVEIFKGHVSRGHIHIFVSVPPHISVRIVSMEIIFKFRITRLCTKLQ